MLSWQLAQEYPSSAEEAFIKSGNPVFDLDVLHRMMAIAKDGTMGYLTELSPRVVGFRKDAYSLA